MQSARLFPMAHRSDDVCRHEDDACPPCLDVRAVEFGAIWPDVVQIRPRPPCNRCR